VLGPIRVAARASSRAPIPVVTLFEAHGGVTAVPEAATDPLPCQTESLPHQAFNRVQGRQVLCGADQKMTKLGRGARTPGV
jgi:hypothetical protein